MKAEECQFLLTAAWLFVRHGQPSRARALVEALVEADGWRRIVDGAPFVVQ